MTLLIDAAPIVALADPDEPLRGGIVAALRDEIGALIIPALVAAEVDYLLGRYFGRAARLAFMRDLAAGRFTVDDLERDDYTTAMELEERYEDLELGLADCSLIVLANRHQTTRILSFDQRHFRAVTPLRGIAFTILPADR